MRIRIRQVLASTLGAVALALLSVASTHLAYPDAFSPWNPAMGVGAGLLMLGGTMMALPVVAGLLAGAWWTGWLTPIGGGVGPVAVSAVAPVVLGLVVRRFLDPDPRAWTVRQVVLLILTMVAAGLLLPLFLIPLAVPGLGSAPADFRVGVGTATGGLLGLAAVAVLALASRSSRWRPGEGGTRGSSAEFLGHVAVTLAVGAAAYVLRGPTGERFWSLYFLPLIWTAFRFQMPEVVAGLVLMDAEAIALAAVLDTPLSALTNFHFFFFNFTGTAFLVAAALAARREAERAKAEGDRRLQEEVAFRARLLENVGEAIVGTDAAGQVLFWNAAAERMFGVPRQQALGRDIGEVVRYHHADGPAVQSVLRANTGWSGEVVVRRRDGAELFALATTVPLEGTDGRAGFVGVWRDVTGKRELEEQLAQAQKMDAIGRLAGGVAHDFNNLLTVVHLSAAEAKLLAVDNPELTSLIDGIQDAAERGSAMTRRLLSFTRSSPARPRLFAVSAVVAGLEKMLRRLLGERVDIVVTSESDGLVRGDSGQLEQVLVNLAVNSLDAMPDGGTLAIHTDALAIAGDTARSRDILPGDYVRLRVTDDGAGMDADILSKAFEPFFTTKPIGQGTGLGLSTAYAMVRQAGGQIWAESAPGKGTVVSILLPRAPMGEEEEGEGEEASAQLLPPGDRSGTVLVAEDDARVAEVAQQALVRAGFRVLLAADGAAALEMLRQQGDAIDLLLTDAVMPRMTGPELVRQARAFRPGLPVVLMSGYADNLLEELPQPYTFIPKPFGPRDLLRAVQESMEPA